MNPSEMTRHRENAMNSTHGLSLDKRSRKAVIVAMILSLLALSAPASAAPGDRLGSPGVDAPQTSHTTTYGRSWS